MVQCSCGVRVFVTLDSSVHFGQLLRCAHKYSESVHGKEERAT